MVQRSLTVLILVVLAALAGCRRETADPDMTAAMDTTADTSGTVSATTTASTGGSVSAMSPADKEFVVQIAKAGMAEVQLSEVALQKAENAEVKLFAQRMVADHGRGNLEIQQMATTKGLALPTSLDQQHQEALQELQGASGAEFDRLYVTRMMEDHQKTAAMLENGLGTLQDADLKNWVSRTLPMIREHLQVAQTLQSRMQ